MSAIIRWKIPSAAIRGRAHKVLDVPGEDYRSIKVAANNAVVVLTDGAGFAPKAYAGAREVAELLSNKLLESADKVLSYPQDIVRAMILHYVGEILRVLQAENPDSKAEDFSTTAAGWISDGEKYLAFSVGDSLIGRVRKDGTISTILEQERGAYANSSYFITDPNAEKHLLFATGDIEDEDVFFLMTDGSAECLYNPTDGSYAPALSTMAEWTRLYTRESVNDGILDVMMRLFRHRTSDDCALALAYRQV